MKIGFNFLIPWRFEPGGYGIWMSYKEDSHRGQIHLLIMSYAMEKSN